MTLLFLSSKVSLRNKVGISADKDRKGGYFWFVRMQKKIYPLGKIKNFSSTSTLGSVDSNNKKEEWLHSLEVSIFQRKFVVSTKLT